MKKIEQNSIIIGFIIAIIIFLSSTIFLISSIYPSILDIERGKESLNNEYIKYTNLVKKGFDFEDFKIINKKYLSNNGDKEGNEILKDSYYNKIYKNIDEILYNKAIFINTNNDGKKESVDYQTFKSQNNFLTYLENRLAFLQTKKEGTDFSNKKDMISKVLPVYSNVSENNELTDLSFIKYIEGLLYNHNLSTKSKIGIKDIYDVKDEISDKSIGISYILLPLDLTGTKGDILNFLKLIKNSGNIIFKNNDFNFSKVLGSENQLSEVESLKLKEYIDSSYKQRTLLDNTLESFLYRTNQNNDIIDIQLNLKFFISTISSSKISEKINNIIGKLNKKSIINDNNKKEYRLFHYNYTNLVNIVKTIRARASLNKNGYYKQKINNIFLYLNNPQLKKDINFMKKELKDEKKLDKVYSKALKYKKIFLKLDSEIYIIATKLGIESDKIDEKTKKIITKSIYPNGYIFEK